MKEIATKKYKKKEFAGDFATRWDVSLFQAFFPLSNLRFKKKVGS